MSGGEQEGRCPAVALHAGDEEPSIGMGQFAGAMRAHRAAAMEIGINQGAEGFGAFEPGIERQADLPQHAKLRPEAGGDDQLIRRERRRLPRMFTHDAQASVTFGLDGADQEGGQHLHGAAFHQMPGLTSKRAARGKAIGPLATEGSLDLRPPHDP